MARRLGAALAAAILTGALLAGCGLNLGERQVGGAIGGSASYVPSGTAPSSDQGGSSGSASQGQKAPPPFLTGGISLEGAKALEVVEGGTARKGRKSRQFYLDAGDFDIWFFYAVPGGAYRVTIVAWAGDPDLYVYYPERSYYFPGLGWVDWLFDITTNPVATVSFFVGPNYPYWFGPYQVRYVVVYACTPCVYSIYVERIG